MEKIGSCTIVYGDNVETLSFDWGTLKLLSEPTVTGGRTMTFGMLVVAPGKGRVRHNHPNADPDFFEFE